MKWIMMTGGVLATAMAATQAAIVAESLNGKPQEIAGQAQAAAPEAPSAPTLPNESTTIGSAVSSGQQPRPATANFAPLNGERPQPAVAQSVANSSQPIALGQSQQRPIATTVRGQLEAVPQTVWEAQQNASGTTSYVPRTVMTYRNTGQNNASGLNATQPTRSRSVVYGTRSGLTMVGLDKEEQVFEQQAMQLAQKYQLAPKEEREAVRERLLQVTETHFDHKLDKREKELAQLESRLEQIRTEIERRRRLRDEIIQKRIGDLLQEGSELDWNPSSNKEDRRFPTARTLPPMGIPAAGPLSSGPAPTPSRLAQPATPKPAPNVATIRPGQVTKPAEQLPAVSPRTPGVAGTLVPRSNTNVEPTRRFPGSINVQSDANSPSGWAQSVSTILDMRERLQALKSSRPSPANARNLRRLAIELDLTEQAMDAQLQVLTEKLRTHEAEANLAAENLDRIRQLFKKG